MAFISAERMVLLIVDFERELSNAMEDELYSSQSGISGTHMYTYVHVYTYVCLTPARTLHAPPPTRLLDTNQVSMCVCVCISEQ